MKWVFKYDYKMILSNKPGYLISVCCGGSFRPEKAKAKLRLSDFAVVYKYKDWSKQPLADFGLYAKEPICSNEQYFEEHSNAYIGKWSKELEKEVELYYIIIDKIIHKFFICKNDTLMLSDVTGYLNILEYNGNMMAATPDDGDEIFDTLEEAKKELKKKK